MKIYDTSLRAKVDFEPLEPGVVRMYVCGPTVYDQIHIGNARTFLSFDVIRRWLIARGYKVTMAQNLTDVDDKIINRANETGQTTDEVSTTYANAFIEQMHRFGILDPDIRPRATHEIGPMIEMIQQLIDKGHAYQSGDDVFFSVRSDPRYGHVSNRDVEDQLAGARVETADAKRDPLDFVLWKAAKPGEPTWDSPWGPGRPGWHSECAAMVHRYLGMPIDIHGGGSDLAFPHHENESAQAECCWGGTFANHWMHTGMLLVNGEKMSKSLGNFFTLKDVLDEYPADALRLLMLQTHYRSALDFSFERLNGAVGALERVRTSVANLAWAADHAQGGAGADDATDAARALEEKQRESHDAFFACMDDDFNTAGALAAVFDLVSSANTYLDAAGGSVSPACASSAASCIAELLGYLGIDANSAQDGEGLPSVCVDIARKHGCYEGDNAEEAAQALLELRATARAQRDWATADAIRDELAGAGLVIEDTASGARVKRS
jgi:cysteinyl-tRNA synthetase